MKIRKKETGRSLKTCKEQELQESQKPCRSKEPYKNVRQEAGM